MGQIGHNRYHIESNLGIVWNGSLDMNHYVLAFVVGFCTIDTISKTTSTLFGIDLLIGTIMV